MNKKIFFMLNLIFLLNIFVKAQNNQQIIEDGESKKIEDRINSDFFDEMFDDKFFSKDYDPFQEIMNFYKRMMKILDEHQKKIFSDSFKNWSYNRIGYGELKVNQKEDGKYYIVEIITDNLENKNLSIEIKNDYIKISSEYKNISEKKSEKNYQSSSQYFNMIRYISLPVEYRGKEYKIENEKDKIIIRFIK